MRAGEFLGEKAMGESGYPYGYEIKDGKIIKNEEEQKAIAIMNKMAMNYKKPYHITRYLNKHLDEYKPRGLAWYCTSVIRILDMQERIREGADISSFFPPPLLRNLRFNEEPVKNCIDEELKKSGLDIIGKDLMRGPDGREVTIWILRRLGVEYLLRESDCFRIPREDWKRYTLVKMLHVENNPLDDWIKENTSYGKEMVEVELTKLVEEEVIALFEQGAIDYYEGKDKSGEFSGEEKKEYEEGWLTAMNDSEKNGKEKK
jgi:hypothetical protein